MNEKRGGTSMGLNAVQVGTSGPNYRHIPQCVAKAGAGRDERHRTDSVVEKLVTNQREGLSRNIVERIDY